MTLGDKIRKYRTLKGLTQAQLGSMVNLTGDRIRQYENNVRRPKNEKLVEIAKALDINPITFAIPNYAEPDSLMHTFFDLEDIYGMHFEKINDTYCLIFSEGKNYQDNTGLLEGIATWINKRKQLQPDLNDSADVIVDKKKAYTTWKARYPYDKFETFDEDLQPKGGTI